MVLALLGTKAVPAGAVSVEDKETDPGCSVIMPGPGRQVPPSPHSLQIPATSPQPPAAQGLTHTAGPAHPCLPTHLCLGNGIPAPHMSPFDKDSRDSFQVRKPRVTFPVTMLRVKDKAPTVCWAYTGHQSRHLFLEAPVILTRL